MNLQTPPFREFRRLRKQRRLHEALRHLREGFSRRALESQEVLQAGRLLLEEYDGTEAIRPDLDVLVLGQCTTSWLVPAVTALSAVQGVKARVQDGNYDNVMQDLSQLGSSPDVIVLFPWHQRLFGTLSGSAQERVQEELGFWRQAWQFVPRETCLIQIGYDWIHPGAMGHHLSAKADGWIQLVRLINGTLREHLPRGAFFIDLEQISGLMGRESFYDPRGYLWARQPLSDPGTVRLAEHVSAGIRALVQGPKKVLVLDLDNTLWGGVVGEEGPLGLELGESPAGEAFRHFQSHLKDLSRRGCLLAVCSKNNLKDAIEPFEKNPEMVLTRDDFVAFEASWDPKAQAIERIARSLGLGLKDFVFFDDNPAEREHIRQALPEVEVVEVPEDPSEYVRVLQAGLWFESVQLTREDQHRTENYRTEIRRQEASSQAGSMEEYLQSLEMFAEAFPIQEPDLDRVCQLIGKTNQFNLTTRRHPVNQVRRMLALPGSVGLALRMGDRFGDHGLVSVILAVPQSEEEETLRIDTWLMSCRVIGRTAEYFLFNHLLDKARESGYSKLIAEYIPTRKNDLVRDLYSELGFQFQEKGTESLFHELDLDRAEHVQSLVRWGSRRS